MRRFRLFALPVLILALSATVNAGEEANFVTVYFGTYTRGDSRGIYQGRLDLCNGQLTLEGLAAETTNPSFLTIHPSRKFIYAVGEISNFNGQKAGAVSAFRIRKDNAKLELLNQQPSGGTGPCHVSVDAGGKCLLVANYGSGSVASLPIREDGSLGAAGSVIQHEGSSVNPRRQAGPHAHSINVDRGSRFAFSADLGLDRVMVYRLDPTAARLEPNAVPWTVVTPGSGPRHFAFHPSGEFAFVINELASTITVFRYDSQRGILSEIETVSTLPPDFDGSNSTAEVAVHPSGRFVYGSNRGHDSIAVFRIDEESGKLTAVEHESTRGQTPRNFGIDPSGRFLLAANQKSNNVVVFRIDERDGSLAATGGQIQLGTPVCVKFLDSATVE